MIQKEIHITITTNSTADVKTTFQKLNEIAEVVDMEKIEMSMHNKEGLMYWLKERQRFRKWTKLLNIKR